MLERAKVTAISHPEWVLDERIAYVARNLVEQVPDPTENKRCCVSSGAALSALFLNEMASLLNEPSLKEKAIQQIEYGAELLNNEALSSSLYQSAPGYAWTLNLLAEEHKLEWARELLEDLDDLFLESFIDAGDTLNIDLISGISGLLVYAVARARTSHDRRLINEIDAWFQRRFSYWRDGYDRRTSLKRPKCDQDMGIAHGTPGVLASFSVAAQKGLLSESGIEVLRSGYDYLWGSSNPTASGDAFFPGYNGGNTSIRVAWCYGNPGVCISYLHGNALNDSNVQRANKLLRYCLYEFEQGLHKIKDPSLCHGDAGMGLIFSILSRSKNIDSSLRERCFQNCNVAVHRALDTACEEKGRISFPYFRANHGYINTHTLLEGSPGVCLAICAALRGETPPWTELLLLSDVA